MALGPDPAPLDRVPDPGRADAPEESRRAGSEAHSPASVGGAAKSRSGRRGVRGRCGAPSERSGLNPRPGRCGRCSPPKPPGWPACSSGRGPRALTGIRPGAGGVRAAGPAGVRPGAAGVRPGAAVGPTLEITRALFIPGTGACSGSSPGLWRPPRPGVRGLPVAPERPRRVAATIDRATLRARRSRSPGSESTRPGPGSVSSRTSGTRSEWAWPPVRSRAALAWTKRSWPFEPRAVRTWPVAAWPFEPRPFRPGPERFRSFELPPLRSGPSGRGPPGPSGRVRRVRRTSALPAVDSYGPACRLRGAHPQACVDDQANLSPISGCSPHMAANDYSARRQRWPSRRVFYKDAARRQCDSQSVGCRPSPARSGQRPARPATSATPAPATPPPAGAIARTRSRSRTKAVARVGVGGRQRSGVDPSVELPDQHRRERPAPGRC